MSSAPSSSRLLLRWALVLYTITIVIGILNGTDLVEFERNLLLTHLHAGTLGWITLAVLAAMLWIFEPDGADESGGRVLALASITAVIVYIVGFWTGDRMLRPLAGSAAMVPIVGGLVWAWRRRQGAGRDVPRLGILLALVSLSIGGLLGILLGLQRTGVIGWLPASAGEAHPRVLFPGYIFLSGAVLAEWLLVGEEGPERQNLSGRVQVWLMLFAALTMGAGRAFDLPILMLAGLPPSVVAVALIPIRMRRRIRQTEWSRTSPSRMASSGVVWIVVSFVVLAYLSFAFPEGSFPTRQGLAFDHAIFIGGMTNVLLGVVQRAAAPTSTSIDQIIYFGLNGGFTIFFIGLLFDSTPLIRVGTPILGVALLVAIVVYAMALRSSRMSEETLGVTGST